MPVTTPYSHAPPRPHHPRSVKRPTSHARRAKAPSPRRRAARRSSPRVPTTPPPAPPSPDADLEQTFIAHYLANGFNATRAYLAARPNVAVISARQQGYELRHRPRVDQAIRAGLAAVWKRLGMEVDEAIARVALIARANPQDAFDEDGHLLPVHEWPEDLALALDGFDEVEKKYRFASKLHALRTILEIKKELGGANDLASLIAAARAEGDKLRAAGGGAS